MGLNLLFIGDSITKGTGASAINNGYAYLVHKTLKTNGHPHFMINSAIGGLDSGQLLARYKNNGGFCDPDIVVIMCGVNDIAHSVTTATYKTNLSNMIDELQRNKVVGKCKIVLCTITYTTDGTSAQIDTYNQALNEVATSKGIQVIDTHTAYSSGTYLADGLHPNDSGHQLIANIVTPALSALTVWNTMPK